MFSKIIIEVIAPKISEICFAPFQEILWQITNTMCVSARPLTPDLTWRWYNQILIEILKMQENFQLLFLPKNLIAAATRLRISICLHLEMKLS